MISWAPSRSDTSLICGPENSLLSRIDAGADAGGAVDRDQEPAVVAGQDRDPVAALDAHGEQTVGHRVGGVVELLEGQLALVVDDGERLGVRRALSAGIIPISPQRRMSATIAAMFCGGSSRSAPASNILLQVMQLGRPAFGDAAGLWPAPGRAGR